MSTWAVFNMMGFYPDDATDASYTFTTPVFDKITLNLDEFHYNNHTIEIETIRPSSKDIYIDKIEIDGKRFGVIALATRNWLTQIRLPSILRTK